VIVALDAHPTRTLPAAAARPPHEGAVQARVVVPATALARVSPSFSIVSWFNATVAAEVSGAWACYPGAEDEVATVTTSSMLG